MRLERHECYVVLCRLFPEAFPGKEDELYAGIPTECGATRCRGSLDFQYHINLFEGLVEQAEGSQQRSLQQLEAVTVTKWFA